MNQTGANLIDVHCGWIGAGCRVDREQRPRRLVEHHHVFVVDLPLVPFEAAGAGRFETKFGADGVGHAPKANAAPGGPQDYQAARRSGLRGSGGRGQRM